MTPGVQILGHLPVSELRESPLNPRKRYDEAAMRDLCSSMRAHGCVQPLLVRPMPATAKFVKGRWEGETHFEIVAGHRRYRAAVELELAALPVLIQKLTDADAKAIMLVENCNREDLKPSEEAASLAELVKDFGLVEAAKRVGRPPSAVRERAALAALPGWFLAAADADLVPVSTAAVVAKVPGEESRKRAAGCVLLGLDHPQDLDRSWNGGNEWWEACEGTIDRDAVLTQRAAKQLVRTHFCRELKGAPFGRTALHLVPAAGSCDACPKRAGNDPDLVADGVRADTCTDPECFARKVEAYRLDERRKFARKHYGNAEEWGGVPVIEGDFRGDHPPRGYCDLAGLLLASELNDDNGFGAKHRGQTVGDLLGSAPPVGSGVARYLAFDGKGKPRTLVRTADVKKRLTAAGILKKPERERRVPLGDGEVSLRPAKGKDGPKVKYGLLLDADVMPAVLFDAPAGASADELRERAASAFVDWFDSVDWTDGRLVPRPFVTFAPVEVPSAPPAETLPIHSPGSLPLAEVEGLRPDDVRCLQRIGYDTLADLGEECGGDPDRLPEVLTQWPVEFREADVERIRKAVAKHLDANPDPVRTAAPPSSMTAAAYNARVAELKAASPDWFRDRKAAAELAALWGDGANPFGVFPEAKEETVARAGKGVVKVLLATGGCGLWLSSNEIQSGSGGGGGGLPSLFDTAYDTREAAREAAIRSAIARCEGHQRSTAVEGSKHGTAKLVDQLRNLLGESVPKKAKKKATA